MSYSPRLPAACHTLMTMGIALSIGLWPHAASATQWLSIKKTDDSQLLIDKQSLLEEKPYIKAWIKVEYRTPQKNPESVDRVYTHAKALWYFDCDKRKAATIQVFQYEQDELVYAAGTTAKQADFMEPLPDSEVEITQQYACKWQAKQKQLAEARAQRATSPVIPAVATDKDLAALPAAPSANTPAPAKTESKPVTAVTQTPPASAPKPVQAPPPKAVPTKTPAEQALATGPAKTAAAADKPAATQKKPWAYQGEQGPTHWGTLSPQNAMCQQGRQQSPIQINDTITAALKPLKRLQKFPLKSIVRKDYGLMIDAGSGNMMVLDQRPYQLKYISLHTPAEHQVKQHSYAAEMQMVHEDKTGHRVILSVMFETGTAHPALEKLLSSLPGGDTAPQTLAFRVTPAELMPAKPAYYRYAGSMTTPPCSEGVQWVIMKETLKLSTSQLQALQHAIGGDNARPLQDNQGRMVLE